MPNAPVRIDYLCRRAEFAPLLAAAHYAAFGPLLPDWSLQAALEELNTHTRTRAIPTTLLALDDEGAWLGSVSLLQNDHERIRDYSPWLASLYVKPEARSRGVGQALIEQCVLEARALGVRTLYLYCTDTLVDFYRARGWQDVDRKHLTGAEVVVMGLPLSPVDFAEDYGTASEMRFFSRTTFRPS